MRFSEDIDLILDWRCVTSENPLKTRSNSKISAALNIPLRTLQRELSRLKGAGQITFLGAPKTGGYFGK